MPIVRLIMTMILTAALYGCAIGELSHKTHLTLESVIDKDGKEKIQLPIKNKEGKEIELPFKDKDEKVIVITPTTDTPRPAIGTRCEYGLPNDKDTLFAVRPGVGTRVTLMTWSAGTLKHIINIGNTYPPLLTPTTIALRLVGIGQSLDPAERAVLATFLTASRTKWARTAGSDEFYPIDISTRLALVNILEENQALLWNALVRSMCIEVRKNAPNTTNTGIEVKKIPAIRAIGNMTALCVALPDKNAALPREKTSKTFSRVFIKSDGSSPICGTNEYRSLNGEDLAIDNMPWSAAFLAVVSTGGGEDYYDSGNYGSPKTLLGELEFNAVRPFYIDAPPWSLESWETSGICSLDGKITRIDAVQLRGGLINLKVVEDRKNAGYEIVAQGMTRKVQRIESANGYKFSIARNDLKYLTASDVRKLRWYSVEGDRKVNVPHGCAQVDR